MESRSDKRASGGRESFSANLLTDAETPAPKKTPDPFPSLTCHGNLRSLVGVVLTLLHCQVRMKCGDEWQRVANEMRFPHHKPGKSLPQEFSTLDRFTNIGVPGSLIHNKKGGR